MWILSTTPAAPQPTHYNSTSRPRKVKVLQSAYIEADPKNARTLLREVLCHVQGNWLHHIPHLLRHPHSSRQYNRQAPAPQVLCMAVRTGQRMRAYSLCGRVFNSATHFPTHFSNHFLGLHCCALAHTHTYTPAYPLSVYVCARVCAVVVRRLRCRHLSRSRVCAKVFPRVGCWFFFIFLSSLFCLFFYPRENFVVAGAAAATAVEFSELYICKHLRQCVCACMRECVCLLVSRYILACSYKSYARIHTFPQWGDDSL